MLRFKKGVMVGNKFRIFNNSKEAVICAITDFELCDL